GWSPPAAAQQTDTTLTVEEALELARQNNPDYLATSNDERLADWSVRAAYGALMPSASLSGSMTYQAAGDQRFGVFTGSDLGIASTTDYYASSYGINLGYRLDGSSLFAPGRERASRRATAASIEAARYTLEADVTVQYLTVLRAQDGVTLAEQELARATENARLAESRVAVGAAIPLEQKQAEVERGRAEVALLRARNDVRTQRLLLSQIVGVDLPDDVVLTTLFEVRDVPWQLETLVATAMAANPDVVAARASENAANAGVRMARSAYFPSLNLSAGWSGFARQAGNEELLVQQARDQMRSQAQSCQLLNQISAGLSSPLPETPADCSVFVVSAEQADAIRRTNSVFPFGFEPEPFSAQLSVSLPIFQGFERERQMEEARIAADDAEHRVRAQELRIRTAVERSLLNLQTARESVVLEARNRALADEQLALERERYRVGVASFVELQEAETLKARADREYLTALYAFHENLAALEAAVGRPLRVNLGER
ncbi:MAG: TolC family protein, partial [Longimicrobiales bacterium]